MKNLGILSLVLLAFLLISGWVMNIVKLARADFEAPYKTEIVRIIGLVPPVGVIVGHMTIGEENENKE